MDIKKLLKENFNKFARFGETGKNVHTNNGKAGSGAVQQSITMTSKNFDKWMKESGVIDGKRIKPMDTDIAFTKVLSRKTGGTKLNKYIVADDLILVFEEIAEFYAKESCKKDDSLSVTDERANILQDIIKKATECSQPKISNIQKKNNNSVFDRLTDPAKYTGSHKNRFDEEGKGRGKDGRYDSQQNDGYVTGFKTAVIATKKRYVVDGN